MQIKLSRLDESKEVIVTDEMNEIIMGGNFTLAEIKLINIYLSLVDQTEPDTRDVYILLTDIWHLMKMDENWKDDGSTITHAVEHLAVVTYPMFHRYDKKLFRMFKTFKDHKGRWIVGMSAHDDIINYVFPPLIRHIKIDNFSGMTVTWGNKTFKL